MTSSLLHLHCLFSGVVWSFDVSILTLVINGEREEVADNMLFIHEIT